MRLAFALAVAVQALVTRAADPGVEAAQSYTLEASVAPATLQVGGAGVLRLAIKPSAKTHVHPQAPLKVTLSASAGLALAKAQVGRADLAEPKAEAPRFEAPFKATAAGAQEVTAKVDFFICSDAWCVKQVREVKLAVEVK
jgi:hypothetical protein